MGGIYNSVKTRPQVQVDTSSNQASNGSDGLPPAADGITTPSVPIDDVNCIPVVKASEVSSRLGRAGTAGLEKAVEILSTLGTNMANLNHSIGFTSGGTTNKISILAFEVANTIVRGSNLMQSLSTHNIKHLKEVVLPSEGVQNLISSDMDELLRIAAADKREELSVFSREVVCFGNLCPQWHNLNRYFARFDESELTPKMQSKEEAEIVRQQLMDLVKYTAELYHHLLLLDKLENDYRQKLQDWEKSLTTQIFDSLSTMQSELKRARKQCRLLKKKSLWSRNMDEVTEGLTQIVSFLHFEIRAVFGTEGNFCFLHRYDFFRDCQKTQNNLKGLGPAGLALHYANIITQIDTLVSRSDSVTDTSDTPYQRLPPRIKFGLRRRLRSFQIYEEPTFPQMKAEMEKTLEWLVPIAANTTKSLYDFGWVGDCANTGVEASWKCAGQLGILKVETLYHANLETTEMYICRLVVLLHYLKAGRSPGTSPVLRKNHLTVGDQNMLCDVSKNTSRLASKSRKDQLPIGTLGLETKDLDIDQIKLLDVIDGVDRICRF